MALGKAPNRELQPFFKRLPPDYATFSRRGTSLVAIAQGRLLYGFSFNPTIGDRALRWISYFVQPLYVPEHFVNLSWGDRIAPNPTSGISHFPQFVHHEDAGMLDRTFEQMRRDGLSVLGRTVTLAGFYEYVRDTNWLLVGGLRLYEALTSTAILLGLRNEALNHIQDGMMHAALNPREPGEVVIEELGGGAFRGSVGLREWEIAIVSRLRLLRAFLQMDKVEEAVAQLDEWQQFTVNSLGISDLVRDSNK